MGVAAVGGLLASTFAAVDRVAAAETPSSLLTPDDDPMGMSAELNVVMVSSSQVTAIANRIGDLEDRIAAARGAQADATGRLRALDEEVVTLEAERQQLLAAEVLAGRRRAEAGARVERHETAAGYAQSILDEISAAAFVGGNDDAQFPQGAAFTTAGRRTRYAAEVLGDQLAKRKAALEARSQAAAAEAEQAAELDRLAQALLWNETARNSNRAEAEATVASLNDAAASEIALLAQGVELRRELAAARRTAQVAGADFPLVILDAFVRAERREAQIRPGCRLDWRLIAAISKIESNHGTFGGSTVDATGQTQSIIGPRLDGTEFANIPDSDGGRLDGDPLYDRAVGPMQFIPTSWVLFGVDGNGDGLADPRNYYDAALAAGEHLCRPGYDTGTDAGLRAAVFGYNQSLDYVASVVSLYNRYQSLRW